MRSFAFVVALALLFSQLVASAPPHLERHNVARDAPNWGKSNPWSQQAGNPAHQGQRPNAQKQKPDGDKDVSEGEKDKQGKNQNAQPYARVQKPNNGDGEKQPGNRKPGKGDGEHPQRPNARDHGDGTNKPQTGMGSIPQQGSNSVGGGSSYQAQVLKYHNVHRANHSAPALTWSPSLAATAQKIAETCNYGHSMGVDGGGYGQNIAAGVRPGKIGQIISNMFYNNEEPAFAGQYGKSNPTGFEQWGHFSQVVWKATTQVGCHTCDCSKKGGLKSTGGNVPPFFTVCNYKGPGNVAGQYADNIGRPLGKPIVSG